MNTRCSYPTCGSYALNIAPESGLCDVHFYKVQRDEMLAALKRAIDTTYSDKLQAEWIALVAKAEGRTT